ncbi:hypothetical protein BH24ACT26_BH24ACT26_01890 [soil metagenome]
MRFDAIVLAGGSARRLGGADKAMVDVGGVALLERVLDAVGAAQRVIVVGPPRPTVRSVLWATESPTGGGPVAALAAGLEHVTEPVAVVLAADLPFIDEETVVRLLTASDEGLAAHEGLATDGAILVDEDGCDQPLAGAYETESLRAALASLRDVAGASVRDLVARLTLVRIEASLAARDCDTWEDIDAARRALRR